MLLITGVLDWEDLITEKAAWGVFIWYGGLLRMAEALGQREHRLLVVTRRDRDDDLVEKAGRAADDVFMCSRMCAMPVQPSTSSIEPTRTHTICTAVGAR